MNDEKKQSFVIRRDWMQLILDLPDAPALDLARAIFAYCTGREYNADAVAAAIFETIKPKIDEDTKAYKEKCEKNAENIRKRWANKDTQGNTSEYERIRTNTNVYERTYDNDNDNDIDNKKKSSAKALLKEIADAWNSYSKRGNIPKVVSIPSGSMREKLLHARLKSFGKDQVLAAVDNVFSSSFLRGENDKGWACSFDWFLKPNNFVKILDGNYNDNEAPQRKDSAGALSAFYEDAVKWAQGG